MPTMKKITGEHAHAIRDASGNTVAHVTWDFKPPGEAILKAALPTIALSLGLVVLLTVAAAVTMRRLTRKLADSERRRSMPRAMTWRPDLPTAAGS